MKHNLPLIVVISLIFSIMSFYFVFAEQDINPPVVDLQSLRITPSEILDGNYLDISINATDDLSGVEHVYLSFSSPTKNKHISVWLSNKESRYSETYTSKIYIEPFIEPGIWNLEFVETEDWIGNYYQNNTLSLPSFTIKNSEFYLRGRDSRAKSFGNRTINLTISPNNDDRLDSFELSIPNFINNINYTLNFIKSGIIKKSFSKNNKNYIEEEWWGDNNLNSIEEGVYDISLNIAKNNTSNFTYGLGQINVDITPAEYDLDISNNILSYNSSYSNLEDNNLQVNLSSEEDLYWDVALQDENGEIIYKPGYFKSKNIVMDSWFVEDHVIKMEFSGIGNSYGYEFEFESSASYEENFEEDYYFEKDEDEFEEFDYNYIYFNDIAKYKLVVNGFDNAGNVIASKEVNLSFYSLEDIDYSSIFVHSIGMQKYDSIADNTFENGFNATFFVTFPQEENNITLRVDDWKGYITNSKLATDGNTKILYKGNEYNVGSSYSNSQSFIVTDEDSFVEGLQVHFNLLVKIPTATTADAYFTSYSIKST